MREVKAGEFKAKCLALLDEVAATGEEIVVTKRGRAVAMLSPVTEKPVDLFGSMRGQIWVVDQNGDLEPDPEDLQAAETGLERLAKELESPRTRRR